MSFTSKILNQKKYIDSMTPQHEMALALLDPKSIKQAAEQFSSGVEITPIELYDMSFRLFRTDADTINLEGMCMRYVGSPEYKQEEILGYLQHRKVIMYPKPIGYYTRSGEIFVLHEFETKLNELSGYEVVNSVQWKGLSLRTNALIAAFSMDTIFLADEMRDAKLISNGMEVELFQGFKGEINIWLHDKYGLTSGVASYLPPGSEIRANPVLEFKDAYWGCISHGLLSYYRRWA